MSLSVRDPSVRVSLDPSRYEQGAEKVTLATKHLLRQQEIADRKWRAMQGAHGSALREDEVRQKSAADAVAAAEKRKQDAYKATGKALVAGSTAVLAALAFSTKAAMSWESAWAGVTKTVDGTSAQMSKLEKDLRRLTSVLPATHTEIAAVAELAGQLGVHVDDVAAFTRVMLDLGETTNLSAEDAATALAKFSNIMGTATSDTDRLGSTIVALGNNSATTEADIVALSSRLAAAAKDAGLTEANVFAVASSLSSVGVEAEAGGTAVSKLFTTMNDAVIDGGKKLETFAKVSGMTVEEFSRLFREDAAGAVTSFVEGMGRISEAGESTTRIYADLGLTDQRLKRSVGSLASAQGLLADQIGLANRAWDENTALLIEAAQRYETTESRIQIARNSLNDAAITIGDSFLPAVADAADGVADLAQWFSNLDPAAQSALGKLAGIAATGGLLAGTFLLLAPRIGETYKLIRSLSTVAPRASAGLRGLGKAAGIAGAALGVIYLTDALTNLSDGAGRAIPGVAELTKLILDMDAAASTDMFASFKNIDDVTEALDAITGNGGITRKLDLWASKLDDVFGTTYVSSVHDSKAAFEAWDTALAQMVAAGHPEHAAEGLELLYSQVDQTKYSMDELREHLPGYAEALAAADVEQTTASESARELAESMGYTGEMSEEAAKALEAWRDMASGASAEFIDLQDAFDAVVEKNRELAEAAAAATESTEDSWEDFLGDFPVKVDDYIAELERQVAAQEEWEQNMLELAGRARKLPEELQGAAGDLLDELTALGPEGAAQVELFGKMSDAELAKVVTLFGNKGAEATEQFSAELEAIRNPVIEVDADLAGATADVERWITDLNGRRVAVTFEPARSSTSIGRASGGRLPGAPSSKDNMLIRAASGEYVVNAAATARNLSLLDAINSGADVLPGFASGGRVSWARGQTKSAREAYRDAAKELKDAQKAADAVRGSKDKSAREDARKRVERARKAESAARQELREAQARQERLSEAERELRVDVRRGDTVDRVSSGLSGAYSVIDEMLEASRNKDLSKKQRAALKDAARDAERNLTKLYAQAEKVEAKLADARDNVAQLAQIADGVSSALQGEQSLRSSIKAATEDEVETVQRTDGRGNVWHEQVTKKGTPASVTAADLVAGAQERAAKIRAFANKLKRLADMGASGVILQEIAMLGSEEGSLVADALLAGGPAQVNALNAAYEDLKKFSDAAGQYVTEGFHEGGLAAAEAFVVGLEQEQERINKVIAKAGKGMAEEFLDALGLKLDKKGNVVKKFAGGYIAGPGTSTSDSIAARLSNGEFVVNAAATKVNRQALEHINSGNTWPGQGPIIVQPTPVTVTTVLDAGSLARALDGAALTLLVDGQPVRGIVQAELADVARSVRYASTGG